MGPHSKASQISVDPISPRGRSSTTSTHAATTEFFSVPQARPTPRSGVTFLRRAAQPNSFAAFSSTVLKPRVLEMSQPELEGIDAGGRRQLVHERLAGEVVGGGAQAPVGALGQGRVGADGGDPGVRDRVRRVEGRPAGVDAGEVPGDERRPRRSGRPGTRSRAAGRQYAQVNSSSRVQLHRDRLARRRGRDAPPRRRPRRCASRRSRRPCRARSRGRARRGTPSSSARACCARKGPSQPAQTVSRSSLHSATAARGSIGACWM